MRVNLKDNGKWAAEERRRQKRKRIILASAILLSAAIFVGILLYRYQYVEYGRYYPRIALGDEPTAGEPVVYTYEGFRKVVKSPSLPYTMLTAGDIIIDNDEYCVFLYQDAYYVMAETEMETSDVLISHIFPALGADVTGSACFNRQDGYLNNRHVETECRTFALGGRGNLYSISYRLLLPEDRDIVIAGISSNVDVDGVYRNIEKIFYSIHKVSAQKEGETKIIDFEVVESENSDTLIGNIVVHVDEGTPMDEEFFPAGTPQSEIQSNPGGIHKLTSGMLYKSKEEKSVIVEEDFESLAFVFSYGLPVELTDIELVDPLGDIFYPDERHKYLGYDYVFWVDAPMRGEWKFVWSAADRIGNYEGFYTMPQHYTPPEEVAKGRRDERIQ